MQSNLKNELIVLVAPFLADFSREFRTATGRRRLGEFYTLRFGQFSFRINPILEGMAIPASTFLKELVSSSLDFFSRLFLLSI